VLFWKFCWNFFGSWGEKNLGLWKKFKFKLTDV